MYNKTNYLLKGKQIKNERNARNRIRVILIAAVGTDHPAYLRIVKIKLLNNNCNTNKIRIHIISNLITQFWSYAL